jgi:hypothetical protein
MIVSLVAALAVVIGSDPSIHPWPIGPGPRYRPPAARPAVLAGRPIEGLRCAAPDKSFAVHVEVFANRRAIVIPAGIGVARPLTHRLGNVAPGGCVYPARTETPTGVFKISRGAALRVGDLFTIWGQQLGPKRLLSFKSKLDVRGYLNGKRYTGAVGALRLRPHAEIVIELGAYLAPHRSFLFPKGSS